MIEHSLNLSPKATNAASRSSSKALDEKSYEREDVPRSLMRQRPYAAKAEHIHGTESLSPLLSAACRGRRTVLEEIPDQGLAKGSACAVRCSGVALLIGVVIGLALVGSITRAVAERMQASQ